MANKKYQFSKKLKGIMKRRINHLRNPDESFLINEEERYSKIRDYLKWLESNEELREVLELEGAYDPQRSNLVFTAPKIVFLECPQGIVVNLPKYGDLDYVSYTRREARPFGFHLNFALSDYVYQASPEDVLSYIKKLENLTEKPLTKRDVQEQFERRLEEFLLRSN